MMKWKVMRSTQHPVPHTCRVSTRIITNSSGVYHSAYSFCSFSLKSEEGLLFFHLYYNLHIIYVTNRPLKHDGKETWKAISSSSLNTQFCCGYVTKTFET